MKSKIPAMEDLLRRKLTEASEDCTVVFQFLDTTFYFTKRGDDGRFHMEGDSVLAPKKLQYSIFNQAKPLLLLAGDLMKILIRPLPRYFKGRCCGNKKHVPNLEDDNYGSNLEDAVLASRQNLKDFAFRQGLRNIRVLVPLSSLRKLGRTLWEEDQVHISRAGFDALAELAVTYVREADGMEAGGSNRQSKAPNSSGYTGSSSSSFNRGRKSGVAEAGGGAVASATDAVAGLQQQYEDYLGEDPYHKDIDCYFFVFAKKKICEYQANFVL